MEILRYEDSIICIGDKDAVLNRNIEKPYRLTPVIVTFCDEILTSYDIQSFIETGLKIVRFKITQVTKSDKIKMMKTLDMLKSAVQWCCEKYDVTTWPIAISVDVPNAYIRTGCIDEDLHTSFLTLQENTIVEITSDMKYWNKCSTTRIFIDDPYSIQTIKVGAEITIRYGKIVMICTEVINCTTLKCKVIRGDRMRNTEFVCIRGLKVSKPPLTKTDMEILAFAREFELDMVTLNAVRYTTTIKKIREFFEEAPHMPLIISAICEQEGLDNIDDILEESDGIILAREFLAHNIIDKHQMISIQLQVSAKCRKLGKPFYISGNILEGTMLQGTISSCDLNDITNAVLQGAGFVLRNYKTPSDLIKTMTILDSVCRGVEPLAKESDFWRMSLELKIPVNAAEACILSCALLAQQSKSPIVIIPTVTGKTAMKLSHIAPQSIILTISSNPVVAKQLQLYRGIIPIIYDKKTRKSWYMEMEAQIRFAMAYGIKHNLLKYGQHYVALRKSSPTSSFCDNVSVWKVVSEEVMKFARSRYMISCD